LFYYQPKAEAVTLAIDSHQNLQLNIQQENQETQQQNNQQDTQTVQDQTNSREVQSTNDDTETSSEKASGTAQFRATAYCLRGKTASGAGVRRGIVAADPRVLPLGSRIQLDAGAYSGTYTVADTGGAIKGRKLDIWVANCSEAVRFGNRSVKVSRLVKSRKT